MVLIKSFLTGVLHGCFKLIYQYLNEGDKVRECYSCLKLMVHGYLHIAISYCFWLHVHDLSDSNYIWNCCNQAQFLNKTIVMKCLAIKLLHETFYNSQFKKYNRNSTHSCSREIWADIPSYIKFPCF